jgi:streptomycin 6-kinase
VVEVSVPERVAHIARLTEGGRRWLDELPHVLAALQHEWSVRIGAALGGGTASYCAAAVTADGADAVVKVVLPPDIEGHASSYDAELAVLQHGGPSYVRLLAHDAGRRAFLLERLGAPLRDLGWPAARQLEAIAATLRSAWVPTPASPVDGIATLAVKGEWFIDFLDRAWAGAGRPCSRRAVDVAQRYAADRIAGFDAGTALLLHGDGHAVNTLAAPDGGFRLVDPDGVIGEREYDLAIGIREVLAPDLQPDPFRAARELCALVASVAGADAGIVWQWAFVERVSTGLLSAQLGLQAPAELLLSVADSWAASAP